MKFIFLIFIGSFGHCETNVAVDLVAIKPDGGRAGCVGCERRARPPEAVGYATISNFLPKKNWAVKNGFFEIIKATAHLQTGDELCTDHDNRQLIGFRLSAEIDQSTPSGKRLKTKLSLHLPLRGQPQVKAIQSDRTTMVAEGRTLMIEFPTVVRSKELDSDRLMRVCPQSSLNKFLASSADKTSFIIALTPEYPKGLKPNQKHFRIE